MFFSIGMHVHEKVEKSDDFSIELLMSDGIAIEMEINAILLTNVISQLLNLYIFMFFVFDVNQHLLDEQHVKIT